MNIRKLIAAITVTGACASSAFAAVTNIYSSGYTNIGSYLNAGASNYLLVTNGAAVSSGQTIVGWQGANNTAIVTGPNSVWTNGPGSYFWVGYAAPSSSNNLVLIRDGGTMVSTQLIEYASIGRDSGASDNQVIVLGSNSAWRVSGNIAVGYAGSGNQLIVTNGGAVTSDSSFVGFAAGSTNNQAVITGAGSIWSVNGYLRVGSNDVSKGAGRVLVKDGGTLAVNEIRGGYNGSGQIINQGGVFQFSVNYPILHTNTANGIVVSNGVVSYRNVTGADISWIGTQMTFQGHNTFQLNNASNFFLTSYNFAPGNGLAFQSLRLTNGGLWRSTTLAVGSGGELNGNGTIASDSVTNNGVIAPGFSPGLITFTSNLVLGPTSDLQMEIGGTNSADYDRIIVGGSLTLTGALHVTMLNGYVAPLGSVFTLIDGAIPSTGQFDGLTNGAFVDAGSSLFNIEYNYGGNDVVLISAIPEPATLALLPLAVALLIRRRRR